MITVYRAEANGRLERAEGAASLSDPDRVVWIDMLHPTPEDEAAVETAIGIDIPTREEMQEIEVSSRIYHDKGRLFLTASILATGDGHEAHIEPVTFVLAGRRLVTLRYHSPRSFHVFAERALGEDMNCRAGDGVLLGLFETFVERLADLLEGERRKLDALSRAIFEAHRPGGKDTKLAVVLQRIGRAEDLNSKIAESLATIQRLLGFLSAPPEGPRAGMPMDRARIKTLSRDVRALNEYAMTMGQKIRFQLDATLGVINIRQSDIIKIFSVVAFVFLPPTLIASIYGMNFVHMPELQWRWGYPAAILGMLVSAVLPYLLFRAKGWIR